MQITVSDLHASKKYMIGILLSSYNHSLIDITCTIGESKNRLLSISYIICVVTCYVSNEISPLLSKLRNSSSRKIVSHVQYIPFFYCDWIRAEFANSNQSTIKEATVDYIISGGQVILPL